MHACMHVPRPKASPLLWLPVPPQGATKGRPAFKMVCRHASGMPQRHDTVCGVLASRAQTHAMPEAGRPLAGACMRMPQGVARWRAVPWALHVWCGESLPAPNSCCKLYALNKSSTMHACSFTCVHVPPNKNVPPTCFTLPAHGTTRVPACVCLCLRLSVPASLPRLPASLL